MSGAVLAAAGAGALGVLAAWDALAALERATVGRWAGRASGTLAAWVGPWRAVAREGRAPSATDRRRLVLLLGAVAGAAGLLIAGPMAALLLAGTAPWVLRALLREHATRRQRAVGEGAPAVARALADALAGGHPVRGALTEVAGAGAGGGPAADAELRRTAAALALGVPTDAALADLRARAGRPEWDVLITAMLLQGRAGGDLAGLLRVLADDLDGRRRSEEEARTATAQARATARAVAGLPVAAAVIAELARPGLLAAIAGSPETAALGGVALALQGVGLLAVRRIAAVRA